MVCRNIWKIIAAAVLVLWMLCGIYGICGTGGFTALAADAPQSTAALAQSTIALAQSTIALPQSTAALAQSTTAPTQPTAAPPQPTTAPTQPPTEPVPPSLEVNIKNQDELISWYKSQSGPNRTIGVISEHLVINKKVELKPVTAAEKAKSQQEQTAIRLQIRTVPKKVSIRIVGEGSLLVEDPALIISGPNPLFTVEDKGRLTLQDGTVDVTDPAQPAVLCRYLGQITINRQCEGFRNLKVAPLNGHDYEPPDETQPPAGNPGQENRPELTEALLLEKNSDGSGSVKLTFENIPSNITALYIYRSDNEKSWRKEKNRPAASDQQDQGTLEYTNFLKEPGNILNTSIVEDKYIIYRFQSANRPFYIKAEIESPDGTWETQKLKVAIPEYTGQGLTFGYGWGGYDSYGGSYGSYGGGSSGRSSHSSGNSTTEAETDAPEGPVRRGGGRRSSYFPETPLPAEPTSSTKPLKTPETASPPNAKAADATPSNALLGNTGGVPSGNTGDALSGSADDGISGQDMAMDSELAGEAGMESGMPGYTESARNAGHKKMWITAAVCSVIFLGGGIVYYIRRTRKKT